MSVRLWDVHRYGTTLGVEWSDLPGQEFWLLVPEWIADGATQLLPYSDPPTVPWQIAAESARCERTIDGVIQMATDIAFTDGGAEITVAATNLSPRPWTATWVNACFAYFEAPRFDDRELERTFLRRNDAWVSIASVLDEAGLTKDRGATYRVVDGLGWDELDVGNSRRRAPMLTNADAWVASADGEWSAGVSTAHPASGFSNGAWRWRCIHANPLLGPMPAGETNSARIRVVITRGSLGDRAAW